MAHDAEASPSPHERVVVQGGATKYSGNWFIGATDGRRLDAVSEPRRLRQWCGGNSASGAHRTPARRSPGPSRSTTSSAGRKLEITDDGKGGLKVGWGSELPRRSAVLLTGRDATIGGVTYQQTVGGFWVHLPELKIAKPNIPADVGPAEKWIHVDLTRQQLVAFEGRRPVFATLISSGRRNPGDAEHDFPTPQGTFRIREKHVTTTMDADVASDGPYSIDVPWVMYFQGSYALHGASGTTRPAICGATGASISRRRTLARSFTGPNPRFRPVGTAFSARTTAAAPASSSTKTRRRNAAAR